MTFRDQSFMKMFSMKRIPYGIYPLVGGLVFALSGMTYVAYHSLCSPDIGLWKSERDPFYVKYKNNVNGNKSTKLYNVNPRLY